jgi:N-acetylglucosamine-6-phosphate deacetylase
MQRTIRAEKLFTGTEWLYNQAIEISDGIIQSIEPIKGKPFVKNNTERFLAPAFVDFQVYGAAKKLLAAYPSVETLKIMRKVFSEEGTCFFQPTIATNTKEVFIAAIDAVKKYWQDGGKGVHGLHLEGPWINPEKRGAHIARLIHPPTIDEVKSILDIGKDVVKTITIAPEVCSREVIDLILSFDIVLSAGHSNASFNQATTSFNNGISTVTHLYNAMSPLHHREPGMVGASILHQEVMASIIPDGYHVAYETIRIAKRLMGDRLFAITDAVTETTEGPYQHRLVEDRYECNGTLSGSALSMQGSFRNLVTQVGIETEEALRMCSLYPARAMRMEHLYGKIAPGFAAQFLVMDKQLKLVEVVT